MSMNEGGDGAEPAFRSFIPYRVARLHGLLNKQATRLLEKHGEVTLTQWRIIVLLHNEDVGTLSEMADVAGIDKGLLSRNLSTLAELGYVETQRDRGDRRVNNLALTEKGRALHAEIYPIMTWRHERLQSGLSAEQAEMVQAIFDALENAASDETYQASR